MERNSKLLNKVLQAQMDLGNLSLEAEERQRQLNQAE